MTTLFKKHSNGTIGSWKIEAGLHPDSPDTTGLLKITHKKDHEKGKEVVSYVGVSPKNIGRSNETTPLQQAELEAESRIKKQIDKGYVRSLEDIKKENVNSLGFTMPMTAHPIEKVKKIDWATASVQPKFDGHRAMFKDGVLYSRQGKVIDLPHIVEHIYELGLGDKHLDGEIYLHGKTLQEISSLIKRPRDESIDLVYHVYDVVDEKPFMARWKDAFSDIDWFLMEVSSIRIIPYTLTPTHEDMMRLHHLHLEQGYEGTMVRHGSTKYESGKRSRSLLKVKEFHDAEFLITGYREGEPRYTNGFFLAQGVWILQTEDGKEFSASMQGDMWEKNRLLNEAEKHVGKMLTVKYHYYSSAGVPQLPVAMRFREDI